MAKITISIPTILRSARPNTTEYDRLIAEWLASGRRLPKAEIEISISVMAAGFLRWANQHCRKNGQLTDTFHNYKPVFSIVLPLNGKTSAVDFGLLRLKAIVKIMIEKGWSRRTVNDNMGHLRRIFPWAVAEEMIPAATYDHPRSVAGLHRGRTAAKESKPAILPIEDTIIDTTLSHVSPIVAGMFHLQRLTAMRPEEICNVRPMDIDRTGEVWLYRPWTHKTEHHDISRVIPLGPQSQVIIRAYLVRDVAVFCFSPAESQRKRRELLTAQRKVSLSCGNRP